MKNKMLFALAAVLLVGAGGCCGDSETEEMSASIAQQQEDVTSLASCGEFPKQVAQDFPATNYAVCKNADTGDCYYKMVLPRPKDGCDAEFGKYPFGNPDCFAFVAEVFIAKGGTKIASSQTDYRPTDTCENTTVEYFNGKVLY